MVRFEATADTAAGELGDLIPGGNPAHRGLEDCADDRPRPAARARFRRPGQAARPGATKKRMLIIVNPYATTVSDRLKNLVVYALQARYEVEAVDTEASEHAIEIGREARDGGYDIVVAFGGDGTLNEVANGLAGTDVPVSVLPGGSTNVVCRTLGIPNDVVDATEHLIGLADDFQPAQDRPRALQRPPLRLRLRGRARRDAWSSGSTPTRASRPRARQWYYTWAAITGFYRHYLRDPVRLELEVEGEKLEGVTAIAQNSDPFTYFAEIPIGICEDDRPRRRQARRRGPAASRPARHAADRRPSPEQAAAGIQEPPDRRPSRASPRRPSARSPPTSAATSRPLPVQVDGDYIGEHTELRSAVEPGALTPGRLTDCPFCAIAAGEPRRATWSSRTRSRSPSSTTGRSSPATRC